MKFKAVLRADLARNQDVFGRLAVRLFRASQAAPGPIGGVFDLLLRILCGAEIPRQVSVGPGLRLPHGGRGVVVHPDTEIGAGVTLYHGVTLGISGPNERPPTLEEGVFVSTGACIIGPVRLGAGAHVGANAVVLADVPAGRTAVGVPARVVQGRASSEFMAPLNRFTS